MEPALGHQPRRRRIGIIALIETLRGFADGRVFGLREGDVDGRADFRQREKTRGSFLVQTNAAVRARDRPNVAFVKSIRFPENWNPSGR